MSCGYKTFTGYENGVLGYTCTWNKYTEWKRRKTRLVQINTQKYFTMSSLQNYHTFLLQESHSSYIK